MRYIRALLLVFWISLVFIGCEDNTPMPLNYTLKVTENDSVPLMEVLLEMPANPAGFTRVHYPNEAWGEKELHRSLFSLKLEPAAIQNRLEINKDSGWIDLHYPKGQSVLKLRYQIQQDFEQSELSTAEVYRPIVQDNYFHLFSHHLFIGPATDRPVEVSLNWENLPEDFVVHNSFGSGERQQLLTPMAWDEFQSAIFVGGDFRTYTDQLEGNAISLATRGEWIPFEEEEVFKVLKETLKAQRDFWNDHSQEYFTVTLHPFSQEQGSSFQGTGLTNSFATSVSNNDFTSLDQLIYLFNHELMHNWIGHTIENANEEEQYWFSEGFTEYYTFRNIAQNRVGGAEVNTFFQSINESARLLYGSPVRDEPNSELNYENFWSNPDFGKLPYYRGALFAFMIDLHIRKQSNGTASLDDMMRDFLEHARQGEQLDHNLFLRVLNTYWDGGKAYFEKHILQGAFFDLEELYTEMGLQFEAEASVYELGLTLSEDRSQVVDVVPGSAAAKAGVQPGDYLFSRSIWYGSTSKTVELGVIREGRRIRFSYYPIKKVALPQLIESAENWEQLGFPLLN